MLTYHILYNPHAGSGRGQEATYRLNALLPDDRLLFRDITEIDDYGAFFRSLRDDDRVVIAGGDGTLNHSVPQMLAQAGEIREADIRHHPDRNRLMRVMGVRNDAPRFEVGKPIRLTGAYQFLLCTDGYWELIEEDDMLRTLKESATPQQWLSQMNRIILENGRGQEMDNYTAIAAFETGRGLFGRKTH